MWPELHSLFTQTTKTLPNILTCLNVVVNLLFAGAVAKDSGKRYQKGGDTCLVHGIVWAFATLIGGVFVACAYWLLHCTKKPLI